MTRKFVISGGFRLKKAGTYPWPYAGNPNRTMELFEDDVFTKSADSTWMKHTGIGTFRHVIPEEDLEPIGKDVVLQFL